MSKQRPYVRVPLFFAAATALLVVAACGGGNGATPTILPVSTASPTPPGSATTPAAGQSQTPTKSPLPTSTPVSGQSTPNPSPGGTSQPSVTPLPTTSPVAGSLLLTITEPPDESVVDSSTITLRGSTRPDAIVTINGELVEVDAGGSFALIATLEEGPNFFQIIATDEEGNEATAELTVSYSPAP